MDSSIFSKVKKIQIKTSRMVTEIFSGEYRSVFKGRGMEFEEVREYFPGDDIRTIDWNVTARMNRPFVKLFTEERELTVFFLVDVSSSMSFGSLNRSKRELVAELCAVLAFTAIQNHDKVGLMLFSDHIEKYIPPAKGKRHVLRVIRELLSVGAEKKEGSFGTNMQNALENFNKMQRKRVICFLVSDFFCENYESVLNVIRKKHDLIAIHVQDLLEREMPANGIFVIEDLESDKQIMVDFSNKKARLFYKNLQEEKNNELRQFFKGKGIDYLYIQNDQDYLKSLTKFFREREKRIH